MRADATSTVHHVFARIREEEKGIEGPGRCGGGRGGQGTGGRRCGESVREARRTWHHDALHGKQGVRWVTCARGGELACTCGWTRRARIGAPVGGRSAQRKGCTAREACASSTRVARHTPRAWKHAGRDARVRRREMSGSLYGRTTSESMQ